MQEFAASADGGNLLDGLCSTLCRRMRRITNFQSSGSLQSCFQSSPIPVLDAASFCLDHVCKLLLLLLLLHARCKLWDRNPVRTYVVTEHGAGWRASGAGKDGLVRLQFNKVGYEIYEKEQSRRVPAVRAKPGNPGYGFRRARWRDPVDDAQDARSCEALLTGIGVTRERIERVKKRVHDFLVEWDNVRRPSRPAGPGRPRAPKRAFSLSYEGDPAAEACADAPGNVIAIDIDSAHSMSMVGGSGAPSHARGGSRVSHSAMPCHAAHGMYSLQEQTWGTPAGARGFLPQSHMGRDAMPDERMRGEAEAWGLQGCTRVHGGPRAEADGDTSRPADFGAPVHPLQVPTGLHGHALSRHAHALPRNSYPYYMDAACQRAGMGAGMVGSASAYGRMPAGGSEHVGDRERSMAGAASASGSADGASERQLRLIVHDNQHLRHVNKSLIAERQCLQFEIEECDVLCSEMAVRDVYCFFCVMLFVSFV